MNLETTVYENTQARQSLNRQYMNQSGASTMDKVINGFARGSGVFIFLSILISTFSVYQDFYPALTLAMGLVVGVIVSFFIGLALAGAVEFFRHISIKGMFVTTMDNTSRILIGVIALLLITTTIVTHYRSLNVFGKLLVNDKLQEKNEEIAYQRGLTNDNVKALVSANVEASKGINNGTTTDDDNIEAITKSNNDLIRTMMILNGESNKYQTNLTIKQSTDMAETIKGTLLVLFIIIEFLAVFGILAKLLLHRNTDKNVKELATMMDKTQQMQDDVYQALGHKILNDADQNIRQAVGEYASLYKTEVKQPVNKSFPVPYEIDKDEEPKPLPHQTLIDAFKNEVELEQSRELLPSVVEKEEPCHADIVDDIEEEQNEPKVKKVRALDYSNLDYEKQTCIKLMFRYGDIEIGDELMLQSEVKKKLKDKGFKRIDALVNVVYGRLKDDGFISATGERNRYVAKAELPKVFWMEKEAS